MFPVFAQTTLEDTARRVQHALDPREVDLRGHLVPVVAQPRLGAFVLRDHHDAARPAVKAVDKVDASGALPLPLAHVVRQGPFHAIRTVHLLREDSRRLLDDDDVLVLMEDPNPRHSVLLHNPQRLNDLTT